MCPCRRERTLSAATIRRSVLPIPSASYESVRYLRYNPEKVFADSVRPRCPAVWHHPIGFDYINPCLNNSKISENTAIYHVSGKKEQEFPDSARNKTGTSGEMSCQCPYLTGTHQYSPIFCCFPLVFSVMASFRARKVRFAEGKKWQKTVFPEHRVKGMRLQALPGHVCDVTNARDFLRCSGS